MLFYVSLDIGFGLALVYGSFDVAENAPGNSTIYAVGLVRKTDGPSASFVQVVPFQAFFYVVAFLTSSCIYLLDVVKTRTRYEWFMALSFAIAACSNAAMCYLTMGREPLKFLTMNLVAFGVAALNEFGRSMFVYPYNYRRTSDKSITAIMISVFATLVFIPFFVFPNVLGIYVLYASLVGATIFVTVSTMCVA